MFIPRILGPNITYFDKDFYLFVFYVNLLTAAIFSIKFNLKYFRSLDVLFVLNIYFENAF